MTLFQKKSYFHICTGQGSLREYFINCMCQFFRFHAYTSQINLIAFLLLHILYLELECNYVIAKTVQQQLESTARVTTYIHVKYDVGLIDLCFHLQDTTNSVSLQGPANGMIDCLCHLFTHIMSSSVLCAVIGHLSQPMGSLFQESIKKTCAKLFNNAFMQKVFTSVFYYMYMHIRTSAFSTPELNAQVNFF